MSIKIALAGNPNCGKTTLFNNLTGSNQYVGIPQIVTHILQKAFFKHALELVMNDGNEKAVLCGNDCKGDKYNGKKQYV